MPIYSSIKNEESLRQVLIGLETVPGTFATPTARLYGDLAITRQRPLSTKPEKRRSRDGMVNPKFGATSFSGTYADDASYETLPELLQYVIHPAPAGANDGNTPAAYTYTYEPSDVLPSTFSAEHYVEGLPRRATGLVFNEFTIGADIGNADGNWTMSGNLMITDDAMRTPTSGIATGGSTTTIANTGAPWTSNSEVGKYVRVESATNATNEGVIRQVTSNTTTTLTFAEAFPAAVASTDVYEIMPLMTTGIADRTLNYIPCAGTTLAIDTFSIPDKLISFSTTITNNIHSKRFLNNVNTNSAKRGYGARMVMLTGVMEFDDWNEYLNFESSFPVEREVRISNTGPTIDTSPATTYTADLYYPRLVWNSMDPNQNREGNLTVGFDAYGYYDATDGICQWAFKNQLTALPA